MANKPFRVSADYTYWAHNPAADDGQPLALRICDTAIHPDKRGGFQLFDDPALVAEIADVAELYVGGRDTDLRAARVLKRAKAWLAEHGFPFKSAR